jgi:ATP-dependent Clp protease ATP-binding subunit ClpC
MFEGYSERARRVIFFANSEANERGSLSIESEHLLLGILRKEDSLGARLLKGHGLRFDAIFNELAHLSEERERQANRVFKIPNLGHMKPGKQNV